MPMPRVLKDTFIDTGLYGAARRFRRRMTPAAHARFLAEVAFYAEFIKPGDLVFDVGANIGAKTEVFRKIGAQVVAFEPQPACRREMIARCGPAGITLVPAAVGSEPGRASLFLNDNSGMASLNPEWFAEGRAGSIDVPVTTLDAEIKAHGLPTFCKIDVEGFELEVLKGLSHRIPLFSLEYHLDADQVANTFACLDLLKRFGPLSINITFAEEPGFVWSEWLTLDQFRSDFPSKAPRTEAFDYGDIFIRIG
ncbi:FkbM family methyltransferase [Brevundimonas sp.]|uniref:FkbM family methyltransferase n=1 Tax=Brevundimonas sp. TaxID=1871086 RepID=UPI0035B2B18F